jgi:RNA polymerase sigma-70 factor (ECF subfamily)
MTERGDTPTSEGFAPGAFRSTNWPLIARAANRDEAEAQAALGELVQRYRAPLLGYLRRQFQASPEQAEDWLQGFVLEKLVIGNLLAGAQRERGRFRTLLLSALGRYVVSQLRALNARKRRPAHLCSLEDLDLETLRPDAAEPDAVLGFEWLRTTLAEALRRMEIELRAKGQTRHWEVFQARVVAPALEGVAEPPYPVLVERWGFRSPTEAYNALITAKRTFARVLRDLVAEYERDAAAVEAELAWFKLVLTRLARSRTSPGASGE